MRRTVCEPTRDDGRWGEGFTGVPPLSISGIRNKVPASAQPLGFSADVKPSMEKSMPEIPTSGKSRLPVVAGAGTGAASVPAEDCRVRAVPAEACPWPADAPGYVNREPGLEEAWNPAELPAAVAGAPGLAGKAAAAALDPVLSYGMDRRLLDFFMREKQ